MGSAIPEFPLQGSPEKTIPLVGFGTAESPYGASSYESLKQVIHNAIKAGYRHFDTASLYKSEHHLGHAIQDALKLGLIQSRDELFITSKLWELKLEYLDLYLVHFPMGVKPGEPKFPPDKEDFLPIDIESVWEAMEECQNLGLVKSIGVSNFSSKKIDLLLSKAKIPPAVNQVEMNPVWQQSKLIKYCKEKGILLTAFSPLGAIGTTWGTNWVMESEVLKEIAEKKGKTVAQVCLRWIYEQGVGMVVKSFNEERMKENLDIFDWELTPEESQKISQIPQRKGLPCLEFISDQGPYRSLEELWDDNV
ncbi:hypothetical protein FEM48_Zijuj10G0109900 [Ziziphus jujuba var. spinosa]|uniref:NADP-dependent oxidoreductase domain-containing protein n=1 Tax=Ziziphus jujuba var. spinosa TaxID=714518 RepID=A0A978UMZ6_ZIZJJ|nr:hypothetical protein FEM48_Zijuj10G0109900 [Ziziphus jujuba var. spinosa]